jgi:hypothetical protein
MDDFQEDELYFRITDDLYFLQSVPRKGYLNIFGYSSKKDKEDKLKSFILSVIRVNYHSCLRNPKYKLLCDIDKENIYKLGKKIKIGKYYIIDIFDEIKFVNRRNEHKLYFLIKNIEKENLFLKDLKEMYKHEDQREMKKIIKFTIYRHSDIYNSDKFYERTSEKRRSISNERRAIAKQIRKNELKSRKSNTSTRATKSSKKKSTRKRRSDSSNFSVDSDRSIDSLV